MIKPSPGLLGAAVAFAVWLSAPTHKQVARNMAFLLSNDPRRLPVKVQAELVVGSVVMALREAH